MKDDRRKKKRKKEWKFQAVFIPSRVQVLAETKDGNFENLMISREPQYDGSGYMRIYVQHPSR